MTRWSEADQLAARAYCAAVKIINEAPDMGIALAAMAIVCHWMEAESDSRLLAENRTLANIVLGGDEV